MISATPESWQDIAKTRRIEIADKIPEEWTLPAHFISAPNLMLVPRKCGLLTDPELRITESRAVDILEALRSRHVTAVEVTTAFCKRAAIAHQLTNCLADFLLESALQQAEELDEYMRQHDRPKGPLHGLPISVKEHLFLKGTKTTSGLMAWADQESPDDALIVRTFREQGAVFHVKTTNPQTLMALETVSNLFGRTVNPHNTSLTPGGSSGGESALLAMRGSPLGIGTDIGGSIRVPSAFCGIYGLKPSVSRTPHSGMSGMHSGMHNIIGVVGPMAHCVEDMELFMSAALRNSPWKREPAIIPIPWTPQQSEPRRLKIGIMWDDGIVHPHPPVARAMHDAATALKAAGHTLIDWQPLRHKELFALTNQAYFLDAGDEYHTTIQQGDEPAVKVIADLLSTYSKHRHSLEETWQLNNSLDRLRTLYAATWNAAEIDCLLCPIAPSVASVHDESKYWGYSCVFNALDYPATVLPSGFVQSTDTWQNFPRKRPCAGDLDQWYEGLYTAAGPERYANAPLALQLVGNRLEEEELLSMTRVVDAALRPGLEAPVKNPWPPAKSSELGSNSL